MNPVDFYCCASCFVTDISRAPIVSTSGIPSYLSDIWTSDISSSPRSPDISTGTLILFESGLGGTGTGALTTTGGGAGFLEYTNAAIS